MDKIWDRNPSRSLAVVAGMEKTNGHAEPTKSNAKKPKKVLTRKHKLHLIVYINDTFFFSSSIFPYSFFCMLEDTLFISGCVGIYAE